MCCAEKRLSGSPSTILIASSLAASIDRTGPFEGVGDCQAGDGYRLASSRVSLVLALLLKDGGASQTIPSCRQQLQRATMQMQRDVRSCSRSGGYDADWFRTALREKGITPSIPPKNNRKIKIAYDKSLYRQRHRIENMFGKLKD